MATPNIYYIHIISIMHELIQLVVKGHRSTAKSVTFGVVMTNKIENSIISESSSVDLIDGAKLSTKRKSITKLPYKNTKVFHIRGATPLSTFSKHNVLLYLSANLAPPCQ